MTAAATTGPAIGPTPASSPPATSSIPVRHSLRSWRRSGCRLIAADTSSPGRSLLRFALAASFDSSCKPLEPGLAHGFRDFIRPPNMVHPDHELRARRRRDRNIAKPEHPLEQPLGNLDRSDIGKLHLAPIYREPAVALDYPIGGDAPLGRAIGEKRAGEGHGSKRHDRKSERPRIVHRVKGVSSESDYQRPDDEEIGAVPERGPDSQQRVFAHRRR